MEETLNCLRYANRAKNIKNNAVVNVDAGSRLVTKLRSQVKSLASELLRVKNVCTDEHSIDIGDGGFPSELLKSLASGNENSNFDVKPVANGNVFSDEKYSSLENACMPKTPIALQTPTNNSSPGQELFTAQLRLAETETELKRVRDSLRQTKQQLYVSSEQLYAERAEKEYYRLQLPGEDANGNCERKEMIDMANGDSEVKSESTESEVHAPCQKNEFVKRITAYEQELSTLRELLREEQSKTKSLLQSLNSLHPSSPSPEQEVSPKIKKEKVSMAKNDLSGKDNEKPRLSSLQKALLQSKQNQKDLDEEEADEQQELKSIKKKYMPDSDSSVNDESDHGEDGRYSGSFALNLDEKDKSFQRRQQHMNAHLSELSKSIAAKEELIEQLTLTQDKYEIMRGFYEDKLRHMEVQVKEREKERNNLKTSLQKLEKDKSTTCSSFSKLRKSLEEKEKFILELKKKQSELTNLTKVSSRNIDVMNRLQQELVAMKRSKVELQRRVATERKSHAQEVQKLKREAQRKDREATKWKRELNRKAVEAENASKVAKSRLEEVSVLRTKYREAEKRLRMQTLKAGIMEKAGLDAVMRGSRTSKRSLSTPDGCSKRRNRTKSAAVDLEKIRSYLDEKVAEVGKKEDIADKIASEWEDHLELSSRKEELLKEADEKLDHNMEEELDALNVQLQYKQRRIRQLTNRLGNKSFPASGGNEQRGKVMQNSLLEDKEFKSICTKGVTPLVAAQATSKVLFGMVVKERRRVAALARTACSLDQKVSEAEQMLASKDAALRSHMEEQTYERASMVKDQQEQILSLMAMVKQEEYSSIADSSQEITTTEEKENNCISPQERKEEQNSNALESGSNEIMSAKDNKKPVPNKSSSSDRMMLILAKERIEVLESQLRELQSERDAKDAYRMLEEKAINDLEQKQRECDDIRREVRNLRVSLRKVRETLSCSNEGLPKIRNRRHSECFERDADNFSTCSEGSFARGHKPPRHRQNFKEASEDTANKKINDIIDKALRPVQSNPNKASPSKRSPKKSPPISPNIDQILHSSDSSSNDCEPDPEWAGDIMSDLALIAEGQMPPSLLRNRRQSPKSCTNNNLQCGSRSKSSSSKSIGEGSNVFNRLADPDNFTGIQKHSYMSKTSTDRSVDGDRSVSRSVGGRTVRRSRQQKDHSKTSNDSKNNGAKPPIEFITPHPKSENMASNNSHILSLASIAQNSSLSQMSPRKIEEDDNYNTPPSIMSSDTDGEGGRYCSEHSSDHHSKCSVFKTFEAPNGTASLEKLVEQPNCASSQNSSPLPTISIPSPNNNSTGSSLQRRANRRIFGTEKNGSNFRSPTSDGSRNRMRS